MNKFNHHTHSKWDTKMDNGVTVHMSVAVQLTTHIHKGKYDKATAVYRKDVPLGLVLEKMEPFKTWDTTKTHPGNFTIDAVGNCYDFKDGQLYSPLDAVTTWEVPHDN